MKALEERLEVIDNDILVITSLYFREHVGVGVGVAHHVARDVFSYLAGSLGTFANGHRSAETSETTEES